MSIWAKLQTGSRRWSRCIALSTGLAFAFGHAAAADPSDAAPRWWKGNLHTHSLWSDGDDYPEMIAAWYKQTGYHFLVIADHDLVQEGERWIDAKPPVMLAGELRYQAGGPVLEKYLRAFGRDWVEQREFEGRFQVRLKPLAEYRALLEEPGRFLLVPGIELTTEWRRHATADTPAQAAPVHLIVTNPPRLVVRATDSDARATLQRNADAVAAQRAATGQRMFAHINHPNWGWGLTAEDIAAVRGLGFLEIYNGHPGMNNRGDAAHLPVERMWDVALTLRLAKLDLPVIYALAVDDTHHYHEFAPAKSNGGRGWVMVRAPHLTPELIVRAMEAGEFYASTGVTLADVGLGSDEYSVAVVPEPGVSYVIQFIGTRRGYDRTTEILGPAGPAGAVRHRQYSRDVGATLAEVSGTSASYRLRGDELYVRARVVSSKPSADGGATTAFECAWTQPLVPSRPARDVSRPSALSPNPDGNLE